MYNIKAFHSNNNSSRLCRHPCFNNYAFHNAVIHLPIVSECNVNYTDSTLWGCCPGHNGEGDSQVVVTPQEALKRLHEAKKTIPGLTVAAIAGPGEPLADFDAVKETLKLVRQAYPDILLCLSTNGLMLPIYANHLISLGVNFVTVNVNTVSPETGGKIYEHITYLGHIYSGEEGANILLQNQISGISYLTTLEVPVRINTVVLKGINDNEMKDIAEMAKECGCISTNILKAPPARNQDYNGLEAYSSDEFKDLRRECEDIIPQSYYCKPCNAATVETLNTRIDIEFGIETADTVPSYRFAVCSRNGTLTDQHFGHADKFYIYDYKEDTISYVETRPVEKYCHGSKEEKEEGRIYKLIKKIEDCNCVICMRIGVCPADALKEKNINVYTTYNLIQDGIREAVNELL